ASIDDGSLISHSLPPVAVAKARNLKSSVPPVKVSPLAVRITPPVLGRPVFWKTGGSMSETPSVLRYAMSPVSMLTATSSPHGVGPHSRCRSGSPKRRRPASGPALRPLGTAEPAKPASRPGMEPAAVGLLHQPHRLEEVRRVRHEQMQPGIVRGS